MLFHGVYGYAQVAGRLDASSLPTTFMGDGREALWMLRLSWHAVTVVFGLAAIVLIRLGLHDTGATDAPRAVGAILGAFVIAWIVGGGSRRRFLHPGLAIVICATALTLAGSF